MVKNKVRLCSNELSNFNGVQGVRINSGSEEPPLYKRYNILREIINKHISENYHHFLAQPVEEDGLITWHCEPFSEKPRHITELHAEDKKVYEDIKDHTLKVYNAAIEELKTTANSTDLEYLEKALTYINDDFIYCFDNKVVLGIWGMKPKKGSYGLIGEFSTDLFLPEKEHKQFTFTFNAGLNGRIEGAGSRKKNRNYKLDASDIPKVIPSDNYEFIGWDNDPLGKVLIDDITFNALYVEKEQLAIVSEIQTGKTEVLENEPEVEERIEPKYYTVTFEAGENGSIIGDNPISVEEGHILTAGEIPNIEAKEPFVFKGWDAEPLGFEVHEDKIFTAQYEENKAIKKSLWQRIKDWFKSLPLKKILRWLLWLLLILFILWLLSLLFNKCTREVDANGNPIENVGDDNGNRDNGSDSGNNGGGGDNGSENNGGTDGGGGNNNGGGSEFLPGRPGKMEPIDSADLDFSKDSVRIVADRLNVLIEGEKTVYDFANDFKNQFPENKYQIIYYDTLIKRVQIKVPVNEREQLKSEIIKKMPGHKLFIWDESLFESQISFNDPALKNSDKSWYINTCLVKEAWNITTGSSTVVVAIVDDGFNLSHPEFKNKITKPHNVWLNNATIFPSNVDHGTHVAGIALANGNNGIGIVGIAPRCMFMPVQVADQNGIMTTTSVADGVLYAIYSGADVINVSLGLIFSDGAGNFNDNVQKNMIKSRFKEEERLWKEVFKIADERNVTIVVAAGNENILAGIDPLQRPKQAISVSAINKSNQVFSKSSFSNYGEYSTLSAPGVEIYSTFGSGSYTYLDGTSMASPIVTGAIALMKSLDKKLTTESIKIILIESGIGVKGNVGNLVQIGPALTRVKNGNISPPTKKNCAQAKAEIDSLQKRIHELRKQCPDLSKKQTQSF